MKLLRYLDLITFWAYFSILTGMGLLMQSPSLSSNSIIVQVYCLGLAGVASAVFSIRAITRRCPNILAPTKQPFTIPAFVLDKWGAAGSVLALLLFVAVLISWYLAFREYEYLLEDNFKFGLRAVTTSLHAMVPAEFRLFQTVIPFLLLLPSTNGSLFHWLKIALWSALFVLAFGISSKLAALYPFAFLILYTFCNYGLAGFKRKTIYIGFALSLALIFGHLWSLHSVENPILKMRNHDSLPTIASTSQLDVAEVNLKPQTNCRFSGEYPTLAFESTPVLIYYRTFGLSAATMRLFICLHENGWRGLYRGHQAARLLGVYVPFYRLAYNEFRPGQGSMLNSAVTNLVTDGYFNGGWAFSFLSAFIVATLVLLSEQYFRASPLWGASILCRLNSLIVALSGSLPAVLISIFPIFLLVAFTEVYRRSKVRLKT